MTKNILLLSHVSSRPKNIDGLAGRWIFLSQDYIEYLRWKEIIKDKLESIEINEDLQKTAHHLRRPYMDLIAEMGHKYQSPAWWASRIAEKNTAISYLFLYCCYLRLIKEKLLLLNGTLFLVCESWEVLRSLEECAKGLGWDSRWVKRPFPAQPPLILWKRMIGGILRFLYKAVLGKLAGPGSVNFKENLPGVLIHTYVDEGCFQKNGVFKDRYFPGLKEWLEKNGYSVWTLPVLYNLKRSYRSAWKWFKQTGQKFINPYRYYRISDYLFAIREALKQVFLPKGPVTLEGMDVSLLFLAERMGSSFGTLDSLLYYRLPQRLSQAGLKMDRLILEYENMINEKLLILGFRKYLPEVKLISFQHGALYPLLLCNYVTREEAEYAPLPDRVICNGEFFREILIQEGMSPERVVAGPALRYAHLWKAEEKVEKSIDLLIPLPLMDREAVELLSKVSRAFRDRPDLKIVLKPHPMSSAEKILGRVKDIPSHFKLAQVSMQELIFKARVMVAISSSSIYEALAAGVPVVVVGREAALDLNPLGFYNEMDKVFISPDQIREEASRLMSFSEEELNTYREYGKRILKSSFNPINDETLSVFVEAK